MLFKIFDPIPFEYQNFHPFEIVKWLRLPDSCLTQIEISERSGDGRERILIKGEIYLYVLVTQIKLLKLSAIRQALKPRDHVLL